MLHVVQSNKLDALAEQMAQAVHDALPQVGLFGSLDIIVQSPAHASWLKQFIAKRNGICANVRFPMLSSWLWQLYFELEAKQQNTLSCYSKPAMAWLLYQGLEKFSANSLIPESLFQQNNEESQRNRLQFCESTADVFDHYLMFRPDWIDMWENQPHAKATSNHHEKWQSELWRYLSKRVQQLETGDLNRIQLTKRLVQAIEDQPEASILQKPVFLFGLSSLPPQQLTLLQAVSQVSALTCFQFNPCQGYWGDIIDTKTLSAKTLAKELDQENNAKTTAISLSDLHYDIGHPLLASWGKQGRDYLEQLSAIADVQDDIFRAASKDHLLARVQTGILELSAIEQAQNEALTSPIKPHDNSIQIHACHSPLREVEVLHDFILGQLQDNAKLAPEDFIVLAPNIQHYSDAIRAVFRPQAQGVTLPIHIVDPEAVEDQGFYRVFFLLLELHHSRLTFTDLETLLDSQAIAYAFDFSQDDIVRIKKYLLDCRYHWGLSGEHKSIFDLPAMAGHTLQQAMRRLLLGFAIDEEEALDAHSAPLVGLGSEDASCLDKLFRLIDYLQRIMNFVKASQPLKAWRRFLRHDILQLLSPSQEDEDDFSVALFWQSLEQLDQIDELLTVQEEPLSFFSPVLGDFFKNHLQNANPSRIAQGSINFTNLLSARGIPHRVVCLLGMNDGDFPVQLPAGSIDLMAAESPRLGDRSRRDDDQYLFLEALLAAEDIFYLSYQAQSIVDNQVRFPSKLVQELLDYCEGNYTRGNKGSGENEKVVLEERHRLQPFSRHYQQPRPISFNRTWSIGNQPVSKKRNSKQDAITEAVRNVQLDAPIDLDSFVQFFMNPARYYLENIHGINLHNLTPLAEEHEPFELNALQAYQVKWTFVDQAIRYQFDAKRVAQQLFATGTLTNDQQGHHHFQRLQSELAPVLKPLQQWQFHRYPAKSVHFQAEDQAIAGHVNQHSTEGLLHFSVTGISGKILLKAWIQHLLAQHSAVTESSVIISTDAKAIRLLPVDSTVRYETLMNLLKRYQQGQSQCLPFPSQSAHALFQAQVRNKDPQQAFRQTWLGNHFKLGESVNPYWQHQIEVVATQTQAVKFLAEEVFTPLYAHMETFTP